MFPTPANRTMTMSSKMLRIGSRGSDLARWQAGAVCNALKRSWPDLSIELITITTQGDRVLDQPLPEIGGKGLFTLEIENALRDGDIDLAVHSLKDLPTEQAEGLVVGAISHREDARDVLVTSSRSSFENLPQGAVVGTSSLRREAQLLHMRPDLEVRSIRGNVETRVRKVVRGEYDATVLAAAGLLRLGLQEHIATWFSLDQMLPAPGQGALAVQRRENDSHAERLLSAIEAPDIQRAVLAERSFLARLEAGCSAPVGAWAQSNGQSVALRTVVFPLQGGEPIRLTRTGDDPDALGQDLADMALELGARVAVHGG